ncbi:MAG: hybrid sensor histidine kinase/response regulator, partial [Pseudomonadota bacterium]
VAAATHDILQPLNAARLYATSLVERGLEGDDAQIASNIDVSLRAVEDIFAAIMEISRIDAGRIDPEFETVSVAELFANFDVEYGALARERGLDLKILRSSLWVRTDRRMMRRVLQNLISNAIKYTKSGRVLVGAKREGDRVLLIVGDTGEGIAPANQRMIFKEFRRVDPRASDMRGLGLGLSIVERISMLLNADVRLISKPDEGSLFWVHAPMVDAPERSDAKPDVSAITPSSRSAGLRVVCIDNEPAILAGMRTLLGGWGCEVVTASDGTSAMAALEAEEVMPDVVIADYHLDDTTGDEAIAFLRDRLGYDVPGVIITADHGPESERLIREKGFTMLRKPVKAAAVRAVLGRYNRVQHAAE